MGSLSLSPDGRTLAARIGSVDRLTAPAFCDLESPDLRSWLIAPDDASRVEWIATLVRSARTILAALPTASTDPKAPSTAGSSGRRSCRSSANSSRIPSRAYRLRRIGRMGRPLCDRPADAPPADPEVAALLDEARLFFDYLPRDYAGGPGLARGDGGAGRIARSAVRAASGPGPDLLAQGKLDRAGQTIAYLRSSTGSPPGGSNGPATATRLTELDPSAGQGWPEYLAWRADQVRNLLQDDGAGRPLQPGCSPAQLRLRPVRSPGNSRLPRSAILHATRSSASASANREPRARRPEALTRPSPQKTVNRIDLGRPGDPGPLGRGHRPRRSISSIVGWSVPSGDLVGADLEGLAVVEERPEHVADGEGLGDRVIGVGGPGWIELGR